MVVIYALLEALPGLSNLNFARTIVMAAPLSEIGFGWLGPFLVGLVGGGIIGNRKHKKRSGISVNDKKLLHHMAKELYCIFRIPRFGQGIRPFQKDISSRILLYHRCQHER